VLRLREGRSYYRALFADPDRRDESFDWLKANFKVISAPIPQEGRARFISYGEKLCSNESHQSVEVFFRPMVADLAGSQRILSNTLESIDHCVSWRQAKGPEVIAYYTAPGTTTAAAGDAHDAKPTQRQAPPSRHKRHR